MLNQQVHFVEPHPGSVMIGTGKGGVGKSTIASHLAGHEAAQGIPTLLVCVTSQEDDDLGILRHNRGIQPAGPSVMDGEGLYRSIHNRTPLVPVREVRPNLDVVPGGTAVGRINQLLMLRMMEEGVGVALALAHALAPIADRYGRIIFDSAPENDPLEQLAAAAARWLAIPTRSDDSSINGLKRIAANYKAVRKQVNPRLEVAGAFLYASNPSATSLHAEVKRDIQSILGARVPTLNTVVGYREKPARNARRRGLLFGEYAELLPTSARSYDVAAGRAQESDVVPEAIVGLAGDMRALNLEILEHCRKAVI